MIEKLKNEQSILDMYPDEKIKDFLKIKNILLEHENKINEIIDKINIIDGFKHVHVLNKNDEIYKTPDNIKGYIEKEQIDPGTAPILFINKKQSKNN